MKRRRLKARRPVPKQLLASEVKSASFSPEGLRRLFRKTADFMMERFMLGPTGCEQPVYLLYCEGLTDTKQINRYVLSMLEEVMQETRDGAELNQKLRAVKLKSADEIVSRVFNGDLVIYFETVDAVFALDLSNPPGRNPEDSNTEVSLKGPRDGFVEEIAVNVALVRKRLRSNSLAYEKFVVGRRSQTNVALLYIEDLTRREIVDEVRTRLQKPDLDLLMSSAPLEEMLSDQPNSLFPLTDSTTRPDFVADSLIGGRVAVIVDGSPHAAIVPANLTYLLKSPEDSYLPYYITSFKLLFRFLGLWIALFLPGFWAAFAAYNVDQIPFTFLATIAVSRMGLPMPAPVEALIMVGVFEIFREAGERLPKAVGQTISVVGGLVVGDAAIRAGLASTTLVVAAAITAVASYTLVNQALVGTVSILRFAVLISSAFLGIYGFTLALIAIVLYLSRLESYGVPYLAPLSPLTVEDVTMAVLRKPWLYKNERPAILQTKDSTRQGKRGFRR